MKFETFLKRIILLIGIIASSGCLVSLIQADTGYEGSVRIERGSYMNVRLITASSTSPTAIFAANKKRPDGACRVNGNYIVYIGTVSDVYSGVGFSSGTHPNVAYGFPVLSSETFKLDGSMTGDLYFSCDHGISSCELRCIDGLVR